MWVGKTDDGGQRAEDVRGKNLEFENCVVGRAKVAFLGWKWGYLEKLKIEKGVGRCNN